MLRVETRTVGVGVGLFVLAAVLALATLTFHVSGLKLEAPRPTYRLFAEFNDVADLGARAKVSVAGVLVGRVSRVSLDPVTLRARVDMEIDQDAGYFSEDSIAAIETAGLLGDKYVSISSGGAEEELHDGGEIKDTQSALVLENLIGKLISSFTGKSSAH